YAKKSYMAEQYGEELMKLMRGIKAVFDPHNILNPGKVCQ
ncbi:MAG: FAD-linked oxidase C-terminal domain-containing protein, partial [Desulfitobacteriaceae bacterium]|nr:FAD-linked oxidase C-terminal domain-containing protein [Desulfitobacteriaceae bacterium]